MCHPYTESVTVLSDLCVIVNFTPTRRYAGLYDWSGCQYVHMHRCTKNCNQAE